MTTTKTATTTETLKPPNQGGVLFFSNNKDSKVIPKTSISGGSKGAERTLHPVSVQFLSF